MLPSSSPYRRRYKTWERALLHFGFTLEEVELRHDHRAEFTNGDADRYLPQGLPIAKRAQSLGGCHSAMSRSSACGTPTSGCLSGPATSSQPGLD